MKKTYSKPEIVFESFSLSTNIAGDCETKTNTQYSGSCGYPLRGEVLFILGMYGCTTGPQESIAGDGSTIIGNDEVCYHVPTSYNNLFNS